MAIITVPNEESVKLHEKFGFKQVGYMQQVGWKFGEWRDVGYWELIMDRNC
jgi:phosphinothricin acetyltransferase